MFSIIHRTTLMRAVERWVVPDTPVWVPAEMRSPDWPAGLETAAFAGGHRRWSDVLSLPGDWDILVSLRDPLERVLAFYSYARMKYVQGASPVAFQDLHAEAGTRTLAELARDPGARLFAATGPVQTLMVGGAVRPAAALEWPGPLPDSAEIASALACALDRLDEAAWIGLTETLDRDLQTLAALYGWPPVGPSRRQNVTLPAFRLQASDLDPATRRLLEERLEPDRILVARAREIAADRHAALGDALLAGQRPVGYPRSVVGADDELLFDRPWTGSGWHAPERTDTGWFCWTGPERSSWIELAQPRGAGPFRLDVELVGALDPETAANLRLLVNGEEVMPDAPPAAPAVMTAAVPHAALAPRDRPVRITLLTPRTVSPRDYEPTSVDERLLGVAVSRIALTRAPMTPSRVSFLHAQPNPAPGGVGPGTTTLSWNTGDGSEGLVTVSEDDGPEKEIGRGPAGTHEVSWIQWGHDYQFVLRPSDGGAVLSEVTVTRHPYEPQVELRTMVATVSEACPPYDTDTLLLFRSLRRYGGRMAQCRAVAWFIDRIEPETERALHELDVEVRLTGPWDGRRRTANKLAMFVAEPGIDWLVALDNDVVVARDFAAHVFGRSLAVPADDMHALTPEQWQRIFCSVGAEISPRRITVHHPEEGRLEALPHLNSGIQIVHRDWIAELRDHWADALRAHDTIITSPPPGGWSPTVLYRLEHSDQIALAIAIHTSRMPYRVMPLAMNMSTHLPFHPVWDPDDIDPILIHHHHRRDEAGRMLPGRHRRLNDAIARINTELFDDVTDAPG